MTAATGKRALSRLLWLLPLLLLAACGSDRPPYGESVTAFGAPVVFDIDGVAASRAQAAVAAAVGDMKYIEEATDPLHPGPLGRTNPLLAATRAFSANPSLLPLIRQAQRLSRQSRGRFNPALGRLLALWGFEQESPHGPPPTAEQVAALVARHPSLDDITIDGIRMSCRNAAVRLDFGDYGRGYALDAALARLRAAGIQAASMVTAGAAARIGGDIAVVLNVTGADGKTPLVRISLFPDEVAYPVTAARRSYLYHGKRYAALLDPATGQPAQEVYAVTVFGHSLARAAAGAVALFVAGPDGWAAAAHDLGVNRALLIDAEDTVHITPALQGRVAIHDEGEAPVVDGL